MFSILGKCVLQCPGAVAVILRGRDSTMVGDVNVGYYLRISTHLRAGVLGYHGASSANLGVQAALADWGLGSSPDPACDHISIKGRLVG